MLQLGGNILHVTQYVANNII